MGKNSFNDYEDILANLKIYQKVLKSAVTDLMKASIHFDKYMERNRRSIINDNE